MPPGSISREGLLAAEDVQRGAAFGAGFGENEMRAGREVEGEQPVAAGELGLRRTPVQAAGDHEMDHEPETAFETDGDALADAAQSPYGAPFDGGDGRVGGAQHKNTLQAHAFQRSPEDARLERGEIRGDVGQFRHCFKIAVRDRAGVQWISFSLGSRCQSTG